MFKKESDDYYGRWTTNTIRSAKGRGGGDHRPRNATPAYPWQVVRSSWGKENFELDNPNKK